MLITFFSRIMRFIITYYERLFYLFSYALDYYVKILVALSKVEAIFFPNLIINKKKCIKRGLNIVLMESSFSTAFYVTIVV